MHELYLTSRIVEMVKEEVRKHNAKKVLEVLVVIGEFSFFREDQIQFWYKTLVKDTSLENSKLRIEEEKGVVRCPECGYEGPVEYEEDSLYHILIPIFHCPKCGQIVDLVKGRGCFVKDIRIMV